VKTVPLGAIMKREKPIKSKGEMKQVHFDMDKEAFLKFEKVVYSMGFSVSEYLRNKAMEVIKK